MKQKKKLFARGTFSYRVLWISIIYLFLFASVIAPITKIEGENRSTFILISVATILFSYFFLLISMFFQLHPEEKEKQDKNTSDVSDWRW